MAGAAPGTARAAAPSLVLGSRLAGSPALPVWLVLQQLGLPFEEAPFRPALLGGRMPFATEPPPDQVPLLHAGKLLVWGALPILEHLAERHRGIWPAERGARAAARAVAVEAASGFPRLQALAADTANGRLPGPGDLPPLTAEIRRLQRLIDEHRRLAGPGGPFLFGAFCGADALLAPLAHDLLGRALAADPLASAYLRALIALPAHQAWLAAADRQGPADPSPPPAASHLIEPEVAEQAQEQAEPRPPAEEPPAPPAPVEEPPSPPPPPLPPPPLPPPPPAPPPRLEDVDRPPISYLEDPPALGWRRLPFIDRIALPPPAPALPPLPTRATQAARPPSTERPAPAPPARPPQPVPPLAAEPAPARPEPPAEGDDPLLFRLRRPGTALGDGGGKPLNRFARALGTARQRDGEPPAPDEAAERPSGSRPATIKPIGFSTQRRR